MLGQPMPARPRETRQRGGEILTPGHGAAGRPSAFEVVAHSPPPGSDQVAANRFTEQRRGQVPEDDAWAPSPGPISVAAMTGRGRR
jgi:hypothetical protein